MGETNYDIVQANVFIGGGLKSDPSGKTYFVDVNSGFDSNDGSSWDKAFKTLSYAMAVSHANIAASSKGWAARNTIYFKGDQTATADGEDLVKLAQKTDIIGVGSTDWKAKPQLVGKHVIPSTISYQGCRFINMMFKGTILSGGDIFTLTSQHGIEFLGCEFMGDTTTAGTAAVVATACVGLKFDKCEFKGAYTDAVIELGAGQADDFRVTNCLIQGANMGIDIPGTVTYAAGKNGLIANNVINTTLECIKDALGTTYVINNRLRTAANKGTAMAGCIVCGLTYAQDNRCTTGDANNVVYPAQGTI
jgi:hypothetical protein